MFANQLQANNQKNVYCAPKEEASCCAPTLITQKCVDKLKGVYTISKRGFYAFAEDITGQIVVKAHDVTIDLCKHKLDGASNFEYALEAEGFKGLEVFNGTVANDEKAGFSVAKYHDVNLHDLNFYPVAQALQCTDSHHVIVRTISANDNIINDALIYIARGSDIELTDVSLTHSSSEAGDTSMLYLSALNSVKLTGVRINNNIQNIQDLDQGSTFNPLFISDLRDLQVEDSEVNHNSVLQGNSLLSNVFMSNTQNFVFKNCQFNNTYATLDLVRGFFATGVIGGVIEGCQANGTVLEVSSANDNSSGARGFSIQNSQDVIVSRCQANLTQNISNTGTNYLGINGPMGIQISQSKGIVIETTQANFTSIGSVAVESNNSRNLSIGILLIASTSDCAIRNCEANFTGFLNNFDNDSSYGDGAFGIALLGSVSNTVVSDSQASFGVANDFSAGIVAHSFNFATLHNISITRCTASEQSTDDQDGVGHGIVVIAVENATVSNCSTNNNQSVGELYGPIAGFLANPATVGLSEKKKDTPTPAENTNKNINVNNNSSMGNRTGFLFIPTAFHDTYSVQNNTAEGNEATGFDQQGDFFGYFASNYGATNTQDFLVESPIQLFEKSPKAIFKWREGSKCLTGLANVSVG